MDPTDFVRDGLLQLADVAVEQSIRAEADTRLDEAVSAEGVARVMSLTRHSDAGCSEEEQSSVSSEEQYSHWRRGVAVRARKVGLKLGAFREWIIEKMVCCVPEDILEDMEDDLKVRAEAQQAMREVVVSNMPDERVALATLNDEAHVSISGSSIVVEPHARVAAVKAKFAVQVVVALRMKLGLGAKDRSVPGNVELVRREAAKMMRAWGVRPTDASVHLRYVEMLFFEDNTHDAVPEWRARAARRGRFVRWLFKTDDPPYDF